MSNLNQRSKRYLWASVPVLILGFCTSGYAQQINSNLEQRVARLENYVQTIDSTLIDLSNNLNQSVQEYTQGLEASLENYSQKLQINLDERLRNRDQRSIVLNPYDTAYQSIETNTGIFLIAIEKVEPIDSGFRLHLNIGNPNFADYQNFKMKFFWGPRWAGSHIMPYNEWRQGLNGAEFSFQGRIEKGVWNTVEVDLISEGKSELNHLDCEMSVSGVELEYKSGVFNY